MSRKVGHEMTDLFCNSFTYQVSDLNSALTSIRQPVWDLHMDALRYDEIKFEMSDILGAGRRLDPCPSDHDERNAELLNIWMAKLERVHPCRLQLLTINFTNAFCHYGCCRMIHNAVKHMDDWCTELLTLAPYTHVQREPNKAVYWDESQSQAKYAGAPFITASGQQGEENGTSLIRKALSAANAFLLGRMVKNVSAQGGSAMRSILQIYSSTCLQPRDFKRSRAEVNSTKTELLPILTFHHDGRRQHGVR